MTSVSNQTSQVFTVGSRGIFDTKRGSDFANLQPSTSAGIFTEEKWNFCSITPTDNSVLDRTPDVAVLPRSSRPNILLPPQVLLKNTPFTLG